MIYEYIEDDETYLMEDWELDEQNERRLQSEPVEIGNSPDVARPELEFCEANTAEIVGG